MQRSLRDERGFSLVIVGLGLVGFTAATLLAIDVGMFMTARAQAQNAADAGALAGATALAFNSFTDRTADGPAVTSAIAAAQANKVMAVDVSVTPADVTFPVDAGGNANMVQVRVYRTADRSNPVSTLMGTFFKVPTADVQAVATAQAAPANAMTCVKPFMIPDKWREMQTPPWDASDTFDAYDNRNDPLPNPDIFIDGVTSYTYQQDIGMRLVLRAGRGGNLQPSFYYSWKMPGDTGGDFYRDNIANCNQAIVKTGTQMIQEPGNMEGPTIQGIQILIDKDPNTYWSDDCKCVMGSTYQGQSPRVFPIPLYDPKYYADGKATGRPADFRITQFLGFYADYIQGNEIHGIVTNITGLIDPNAGPAPDTSFARAIRLVK